MNGPPQRRQSVVGSLSVHNHKHYTKREYADDNQVGGLLSNMVFSNWDLIVTNTVEGGWYRKADKYLGWGAATGIFPTAKTPGVYEIALVHTSYHTDSAFQEHIVVYVGSTNHLRQRILLQYGKDGSALQNFLRPFLEAGFQVYFRWAYAPNKTTAASAETVLLNAFDYAMAKSQNPPYRDAIWTPQMRVNGTTVRMVALTGQKVSVLRNLTEITLQIKQEVEEAEILQKQALLENELAEKRKAHEEELERVQKAAADAAAADSLSGAADLAADDESDDSVEEDILDDLFQKFLALSIERREKFRVSIASINVDQATSKEVAVAAQLTALALSQPSTFKL